MTIESETLREIQHQLAYAKQCQRMIRTHARNICHAMDIQSEGPDARDVERCAFGRITLEEMLTRIRERKLNHLAARIRVEGEGDNQLAPGPG